MNNILEVRDLRKDFGAFSLNGISFDLPQGYIMGFVGPNGAGKTTTIKLILNVIRADAGTVTLFGQQNNGLSNTKIGVVMDTPLYVDDWTAHDVGAALSPFYDNWNAKAYADYLKQFGLDVKKKVKDLSRGMKIKLQMAAALSHDAQLLILDEPTSGLDPVARDEICDLLRAFVADEKKGVLFSTHITTDLEKTADYITFILHGQIVFTGPKDTLLDKYARVTGGPGDLNADLKRDVIGCRSHGTGFEGMIAVEHLTCLPRGVLLEPITMDEIIIFMNREGKADD